MVLPCIQLPVPQKHRCKPPLLVISVARFSYVHYTTHGTNSFTSHLRDEAIIKCLAEGDKCQDQDSNQHSAEQKHKHLSPVKLIHNEETNIPNVTQVGPLNFMTFSQDHQWVCILKARGL